MKMTELKEKTDRELDRMLAELRDKVRDMRFKIAARQQSDVREVREAKKDIARILTLRKAKAAAEKKA
jgi:ribosomal protein L29